MGAARISEVSEVFEVRGQDIGSRGSDHWPSLPEGARAGRLPQEWLLSATGPLPRSSCRAHEIRALAEPHLLQGGANLGARSRASD